MNHLSEETSPYLRQHADNPVEWFPWREDAFEQARERNVPVLLSVGYSACHWCHVMAHESFENPEIAALMNENFVNIKVDREERPDVDAIYMTAVTSLTGRGGWPMTVFCDHEGRPFHGGTYWPDKPRGGMPSFPQVLEAVNEAWETKKSDIDQMATELTSRIEQLSQIPPDSSPPSSEGSSMSPWPSLSGYTPKKGKKGQKGKKGKVSTKSFESARKELEKLLKQGKVRSRSR